jgi:hypothetical protein
MPSDEMMDAIAAAVEAGGELTRSEIVSQIGPCTIPQFHAAVAALVEAGRLRRVGRTRGTRYGLPGMQWREGAWHDER